MKEGTLKIYEIITTERQLNIAIGVYIIHVNSDRYTYMFEPKDLKDLPPGEYRVKGEVQVSKDLIINVNEKITIGDC